MASEFKSDVKAITELGFAEKVQLSVWQGNSGHCPPYYFVVCPL